MNEKEYIRLLEIISAIVSAVLGTVFHFIYQWSGKNVIAAVFFPVNESVWEHLKLLLYPVIIVLAVQTVILKKKFGMNKVCTLVFSKTIALIAGMIFTVAAFYTYSGVIGKDFITADIIIFLLSLLFISIIVIITESIKTGKKQFIAAIIMLLILLFTFTFFTFNPPEIPLFIDMNSGTAGV